MESLNDGGYLIVGNIQGQKDFGWIIKTDEFGCLIPGCQTSSIDQKGIELEISIYPNPTSDLLNFLIKSKELKNDLKYQILDLKGSLIYEGKVKPGITCIIPVIDLSKGSYFLQISQNDNIIATKIFVVN
ncbi:MAG: T9SS type A sorting domain-containing protein [Saprospiraceae bacterium]